MSENNDGKITKRENPFSQVANHPLRNPKLSLKAKGLYAVIQSYINIPDFILYKNTLLHSCSEGKDAFESAWKELKNAGYLVQNRISQGKGRFSYNYILLDIPESEKTPQPGNPVPENPDTVNPVMEKPHTENQGCIKKNEVNNTELNNTDVKNIESSNNDNNIIHSFKTTRELQKLEKITKYEDSWQMSDDIKFILSNPDIERMNEGIINEFYENKNESQYTYSDFITFAASQVSLDKTFSSAAPDKDDTPHLQYISAMDWIRAMASVYSNPNDYISIGKNRYRTIDFKQRLLQIDKESFSNMLLKFNYMKKNSKITNMAVYMMQMLYNASFDSGMNMSEQIDVSYFQ